MGWLEDIFYPKRKKPKMTAAGKRLARKKAASYKRTGKHFWYGVTSELDFPIGRAKTRAEAIRKGKKIAKRKRAGALRRVYHLDG